MKYLLFYLATGNEVVLSIKLDILIWRTLLWDKIIIIKKFLAIRIRQFKRCDEDIKEAAAFL